MRTRRCLGSGPARVGPSVHFAAFILAALLALTSGCVYVKDHLTIKPDGSGTVEIESVPLMPTPGMDSGELPKHAFYPPFSEDDAGQLFPGSDFSVKTAEFQRDGAAGTRVTVSFKDINALLASPYGQAHSLSVALNQEKKTLTVQARTGLAGLIGVDALLADKSGQLPLDSKELAAALEKLHVEFSVTLPGPVQATGAVVRGNDATWTIDRPTLKDAAKVNEGLTAVMTATCPAGAAQFVPKDVVHLDLDDFAQLEEGQRGAGPPPVDAAGVLAQTKFVPVMATVTRTFDLTGQSGGNENEAVLLGLVTVPRALAPQRFGNPEVTAITDDRGGSLLPTDRQGYDRFPHLYSYMERPGGSKAKDAVLRHWLTISMKVPPREVKSLRAVQGSVSLFYPGTAYVIKVKDALAPVAAGDKAGLLGMISRRVVNNADEEKGLDHPKLRELGLKIILAQDQGDSPSMTVVQLQLEGKQAMLSAFQVFDAQGRPWPTYFTPSENEYAQAIVAGKPKAPLSIGLLVHGGGPVVKVPIDLTDVPLSANKLEKLPEDKGVGRAPDAE